MREAATTRSVLFRVTDGALYVANFGRRFDRRGVVSICRENLSAKTERGPTVTFDDVPDRKLIHAIREKRLDVYKIDRNQIQEDANHERETSSDYTGRSLWELLQNADDALAPPGISSANLIGAKGLGFKSVLEISDQPSIHSGPFDFGFDAERSRAILETIQPGAPRLAFRLPHDVKRNEVCTALLQEGYATVIRLPFRSAAIRAEIVERLSSIEPHFLLLCRNLDTVLIELTDLASIRMCVERKRSAQLRKSPAFLTIDKCGERTSSEWRIWSELTEAPSDSEKSLSASIAVQVVDGVAAPAVDEIPVHVFFPTIETIGSRFLVHGSFALTSNRNSLRAEPVDETVRAALARLVGQVIEDLPAISIIRLFADIVRAASDRKVKRPDRLIQQTIAQTVTGAEFIRLIGGGAARPQEVKTWEYDLNTVVPPRVGKAHKLPVAELFPVFAELRSTFKAQPLRPADYANILAALRPTAIEPALAAIRISYSACLSATQQDSIVRALAEAPIWPTERGTFRSLGARPTILRTRPDEWPTWLEVDVLHPTAHELLEGYEETATARWSPLLRGRLLSSRTEWLQVTLAPAIEAWDAEKWERHGLEALTLIERWVEIPDFSSLDAFVERPSDGTIRQVLARCARVPAKEGWVLARTAYANHELGTPREFANYFRPVADRYLVGMPRQAGDLFEQKRWKALLRYLGVSWEPKIRLVARNGSLYNQLSYQNFRRELADTNISYIDQEWYIEHFPDVLEQLGPSHVAACTSALVAATKGLSGSWRKVSWAGRTHPPAPFRSFADYQLKRERYLPQQQAPSHGQRRAPYELFWPDTGIAGVTPILNIGSHDRIRLAELKPIFVNELGVRNSLPSDWAAWCKWSDELIERVEAGSAPQEKPLRVFYDALLRTARKQTSAPHPSRIVAIQIGQKQDIIVARASDVIWIDEGRFENKDLLVGLGQRGRAVLPVRLGRGEGAVEVLGVRRASDVLEVEPIYEAASSSETGRLESRVTSRRGALAAICSTKNQPFKRVPRLVAVRDLRLLISVDSEPLADRSSAYYRHGDIWLINLQAPDQWEAVAAAVADQFGGHAPDLKYRFASVLRARRTEIEAILAADGIPGYRIKEALFEFENSEYEEGEAQADWESEAEPADGAGDSSRELAVGDPVDKEDQKEDAPPRAGRDENADYQSGNAGFGEPSKVTGTIAQSERGPRRALTRRTLYSGGHYQADHDGRKRRTAAEAASAAAGRGMRAEAWLIQQVLASVDPSWTCSANVRDDHLRETDLLLSRGNDEWHVEVKSLSTERLYWSELEREKAEGLPGRYFMALLVEQPNGEFSVHWSWDPLRDMAPLERRIEWLWEASDEGPSLRGGWRLEPSFRWPERRADRYVHAVRITEESLQGFALDVRELRLLRVKIGDISPQKEGQSRSSEKC